MWYLGVVGQGGMLMNCKQIVVAALAVVVLPGCDEKSKLGESCSKTADCKGGLRCVKLTCVSPEHGSSATRSRSRERL